MFDASVLVMQVYVGLFPMHKPLASPHTFQSCTGELNARLKSYLASGVKPHESESDAGLGLGLSFVR